MLPPIEEQVNVNLSRRFWMGKLEVTQQQYKAVMGNERNGARGDLLPVENVLWDDADAFCHRLTEIEQNARRLPKGWEYCLPSEAQWEYACRAGTTTTFCFGNDVAQLHDYAWYADNSGGMRHQVGQKKANAWGLHDMHGNVGEWCQDEFTDILPGGTDPEFADGSGHVFRGGCSDFFGLACQSSARYWRDATYPGIGFRVALAPVRSSSSLNK